MNINKENYEMYFLDYHEGRLKPGQVGELLVFIEAHPELKEEFDDFENILVTPDMSTFFAEKSLLKKNDISDFGPINASNYETFFIADTENQLTPEEKHWLAGFLESNPGLVSVYELYLSTQLQPDMHIQYPEKVEQVRAKPSMLGWFVGQVMKSTGGKANPQAVSDTLKVKLGIS